MSLGLLGIAILVTDGLLAQASKEAAAPQKDAEAASNAARAVASAGTRELTGADLEAFLDGMMPAQLEREDIAGAAIAVVEDGRVIFAKGYGYADFPKRTPVTWKLMNLNSNF